MAKRISIQQIVQIFALSLPVRSSRRSSEIEMATIWIYAQIVATLISIIWQEMALHHFGKNCLLNGFRFNLHVQLLKKSMSKRISVQQIVQIFALSGLHGGARKLKWPRFGHKSNEPRSLDPQPIHHNYQFNPSILLLCTQTNYCFFEEEDPLFYLVIFKSLGQM